MNGGRANLNPHVAETLVGVEHLLFSNALQAETCGFEHGRGLNSDAVMDASSVRKAHLAFANGHGDQGIIFAVSSPQGLVTIGQVGASPGPATESEDDGSDGPRKIH